jgi:hypothetical protein
MRASAAAERGRAILHENIGDCCPGETLGCREVLTDAPKRVAIGKTLLAKLGVL